MVQRDEIMTGQTFMTEDLSELEIRRHYWTRLLDKESIKMYEFQSPRVGTRTWTAQQTFPFWKPENSFEHVDTAVGTSAGGTVQIRKRNTREEHTVYMSQFLLYNKAVRRNKIRPRLFRNPFAR